ncbi:chemotaxis protein CheD [Thermosulfurimonas dismutans]|uniref:Chemotaxis protein CheD n=1 Tax=Thermosulfurimonas dismutans TaxID=999894 RepID=A0A179D1S8_9BACT|nr:chemotaxis protein CheD [Thermosulfurimonas dismutans]OAQ20017.1 Chemotaxis protein CheD [Thermosulfurimonas dismutans]
MRILVEKGTFKFTDSLTEILYTPNLGACVAIGVVDPEAKLAGLLHYILPEARGLATPEGFTAFFAEEGLPAFFKEFKNRGGDLNKAKIVVAGGGRFRKTPKWLDIGTKNVGAARYFFKRLGIFPLAEKVGDPFPRRIEVSLKEGLKVYTFDKVESW